MNRILWLLVCVAFTGLGTVARAQDTFNLVDIGTGDIRVFSNSVGTASSDGTMVVFEGQLDSTLVVTSAFNDVSGFYLASVRLLTQIKLFDELPSSNEVGDVQGAVAALKVSSSPDVGLYFAWGVSNSIATWVPLMSTNGTQFSVSDGETNYVTFVFNYLTVPSAHVTYQVFVGKDSDVNMTPSEPIDSLTAETAGINSLSMLGVGGVQQVGSASGSPSPLSSSISLSVYTASNSVYADIYTVDERGNAPIRLYAWINGAWVLVGTVDNVAGEGSNKYTILVTGLTPGSAYRFMVIDEVGHEFVLNQLYEVKTITVGEASVGYVVELEMQMLTVVFNTEIGRSYEVRVSGSLSGPESVWTVENEVYTDTEGPVSAFVATSTQTRIRIPVKHSQARAFFRVIMLNNP